VGSGKCSEEKRRRKMIYFTKITVRNRRGQKGEGTEADKGSERTQIRSRKKPM
jgi:hypothetical protein